MQFISGVSFTTYHCRGKNHFPFSFKSKPHSGYLTLGLITANSWSRWSSDWRLSGGSCSCSHTHTPTHMHSCCVSLLIDLTLCCFSKFPSPAKGYPPLSSLLPEQKQFHMTANHFLSRTLVSLSICHNAYLVPLHGHGLFHSVMKKGLFCQFGSP